MQDSRCVQGPSGGGTAISPDAVVIRFRPTDPDAVLRWAVKEHRRTGRYAVSVFADIQRAAEDRRAVIGRLLRVAQLSGIDPSSNRNVWICTSAERILEEGFTFHKDEEEDELREHYSVDLGEQPNVDDVRRLLGTFATQQEWS